MTLSSFHLIPPAWATPLAQATPPKHALTGLDWAVIAFYGLGMVGIGLYYSLRTKNTEDYLLGGRKMNPWGLGLSLFATMLSAISYLAFPGEMIKYGPMMLAQLTAIPAIAVVVGGMGVGMVTSSWYCYILYG